jgi:putative nucleotidyltransferase with HDIG domain
MKCEIKNIVVIDDEKYVCNIIMEALNEFEDFRVHKFTDASKAIDFISDNGIDLVLTDLVMGEYSGVQVLETTLQNHPEAVVILMTGYPTVKSAISVLKKGGYDYLIKPFKLEDLKSTIRRGLDHQRVKRENVELRSQLELMKINEAFTMGEKSYRLLRQIVQSAVRELSAEAASLLILDQKADTYRLRFSAGHDAPGAISEFLRGEGSKGALTLQENAPLIFREEAEIEGKTHKRSFIAYPLLSKGKNIGYFNLVSHDRFKHISAGQKHLISLLASTAASVIESDYMDKNLRRSYLLTIKALANAVEARDRYTAGHTDRVYRIAKTTARKLGWNMEKLAELRNGCILHDIGKIGVPDAVLNKPGKLTEDERKIMQLHPEMGARILRGIPFLKKVIPYVLSHHERYDGGGYPYGLAGEEIPIEGRLLAAADTFDAIMSDRPYRPCADIAKALDELIRHRGRQFDPVIVDALIEAHKEGRINCAAIYDKQSFESQAVREKQSAPV